MTAPHEGDDLTCPRCGEPVPDEVKGMPVDIEAGAAALAAGETVRVPFECPVCDVPLDLAVESVQQGAIGVDVWIEDRRGDE